MEATSVLSASENSSCPEPLPRADRRRQNGFESAPHHRRSGNFAFAAFKATLHSRKGPIKSAFCGVETVSCVTGLPTDELYELVESGNFLWVWNVSAGDGCRRELRFWCREINHPAAVVNLTLNGAIAGILPRRARETGRQDGLYYCEFRDLLRLSKSTIKDLRDELAPVGSQGNLRIPRSNLESFFRRRWLGNVLIRNDALKPKLIPLLADKLSL